MKPLIFITDSFPHGNGGGISQTLYNLFKNYPQKKWILLESKEVIPPETGRLACEVVWYKNTGPLPLKNRLGKWINPLITSAQFFHREKSKLPDGLPGPEEVFILVSTTSPEKLHLAWMLWQKKGYQVIPYFMDDWMEGNHARLRNNSLHKITADLLYHAPARLMISRQLTERLNARYHLPPAPVLEIHNPCTDAIIPESVNPEAGLLVYAGSVWPMHADALIALAKSIHLLQQQGHRQFRLHVFCPMLHWQRYGHNMEGEGVQYMGFKPYEAIKPEFTKAWMLVCAASFQNKYHSFSASSIQTKLTDYISAGRPVMTIAPLDAASGQWVREQGCGLHIAAEKTADIAAAVLHCWQQPQIMAEYALKAATLAKTTYAESHVTATLFHFLASVVKRK